MKKIISVLLILVLLGLAVSAQGEFNKEHHEGFDQGFNDEQFNDNFDDLGTAISSANAIHDIMGNSKKAYWTGKGWHSDIKHFNPDIAGVRDYNSSDIVIEGICMAGWEPEVS